MDTIHVQNITKDYGNQRGVFDVSFTLRQGECVGFLGPNGAGKTTTIRQLMGFIKPDQGSVSIMGKDCFTECADIQRSLGYLPGEIAFMEDMNALSFLRFLAELKQVEDFAPTLRLIEELQLDVRGKIKKMSKGMKQKVGIAAAWMGDPELFILDEPTSGLDPLMQKAFVNLIQKEKQKGKTILMSSHIFEEIEHTCERVLIIKGGRIIADENMKELRNCCEKLYEIEVEDVAMISDIVKHYPKAEVLGRRILIPIQGNVNHLIQTLSHVRIVDLKTRNQSLEEIFMQFYGGEQ